MNKINDEAKAAPSEADIDFWALKILTYLRPVSSLGREEANPKILIEQNNIYLSLNAPEDIAAYHSYLAENGIEIVREERLICG